MRLGSQLNANTAAAVVAASCLCLAIACKVDRQTPDDTLVFVVDGTHANLDPRFTLTSPEVKLSRIIAPGLMTIDGPTMEPRPMLAESYRQIDELTWDFVIRADARFSTGDPVLAEDVAYTYWSVIEPEAAFRDGKRTVSTSHHSFAQRFKSIEVVGERTVRFHLNEPLATLLSDLDFGVVSKRAAEAGGGLFPNGRVIGAGAYRVSSFSEEDIRLDTNPHSHLGAPRVPKMRVRSVRDSNARALMLIGGSADLSQNAVRVDLVDYVARYERVDLVSGPSAILSYLMMNNDDPILADARVRRAIAHAVDREGIVREKLGGRAVLATGLLAPMHWAYRGEVDRYPYDPERARSLLDEAGYLDPDGPGGEPRMHLVYKTSADPFRLMVARMIASALGEVGIDVEVRSFEFNTFFSDVKKGNYQLASMQTAPITEPDWLYTFFHSERIPNSNHPHTHNRWRYKNQRVDELTLLGRRTADLQERKRIYGEVQEILARELPMIPLWHEDNVAVVGHGVNGFAVSPSARLAGLAQVSK